MQKLLRRTAQAKAQAARRARINAASKDRVETAKTRNEALQLHNEKLGFIRTSIKHRREDWELGPLAPRRDLGDAADNYGTVSTARLHRDSVWKTLDLKASSAFWQGDRVVVLRGRDKGRIGEVKAVDPDEKTVTVRTLNLVDVPHPQWQREAENDDRPVSTVEAPIDFNDVRLVHRLGSRDVIVENVDIRQRERYIAGTQLAIPWPEVEEAEPEEHDVDTPRIDVEEETWEPSLRHMPMPDGVLDELRNKYSKFRDRHDAAYLQKMETRDAEEASRAAMVKLMRTPLNEVQRFDREMKKARSTGENKETLMERIGEVMAKSALGKNARKKLRRALEADAGARGEAHQEAAVT